MKLKDEQWIKEFCNAPLEYQKESMKESGLGYFLKEKDYDFFLNRIRFYPTRLEEILKIINHPDFSGYLYDSNSFIYNYLLTAIFQIFTYYDKSFEIYPPLLPNTYNGPPKAQRNNYWIDLFVNSSFTTNDETDLRYAFLNESGLSFILNLSKENANMFFRLINKDTLSRILNILRDSQLFGYLYDRSSFIYHYLYYELNSILTRIDGLKDTSIKSLEPNDKSILLINNARHNELWFDAYVSSRRYHGENDEEIDLKALFFDEAKLDLVVKTELIEQFLKGIASKPSDLKVLLRTVHNEELIENLKTENSLMRSSIEKILKDALGLNVYEMPIVEEEQKKHYKYTPDNFLSLDVDEQYKYFEKTGLNTFLGNFTEREIKTFLKHMHKQKDRFKKILTFIDTHKPLASEMQEQAYAALLPFFQFVFGRSRFPLEEAALEAQAVQNEKLPAKKAM